MLQPFPLAERAEGVPRLRRAWSVVIVRLPRAFTLFAHLTSPVSFLQVLADVLSHIGRARKGAEAVEPTELPLPPSVEAAIVGPSQLALQGEEPKARVRNIFLKLARPSSLSYSAFQASDPQL